MGCNCLMDMGFPFGKMFWNQIEVVVAQHGECTKCHWVVHFIMVNFMLGEFHLKKKNVVDIFSGSSLSRPICRFQSLLFLETEACPHVSYSHSPGFGAPGIHSEHLEDVHRPPGCSSFGPRLRLDSLLLCLAPIPREPPFQVPASQAGSRRLIKCWGAQLPIFS